LREYTVLKQKKADNYAKHLKRQKIDQELAAVRRATIGQQRDRAVQAEIPDQVVRIVTENGKTLKLTSQGFEKE